MTDPDDLRQYHRQATLHVLQSSYPMTAAEIHEAVTAMALASAHPKDCATVTPAGIAGILRTLQGEGLAAPKGTRRNTRHGRSEPTWSLIVSIDPVLAPRAPSQRQPARSGTAEADPMAGLSRGQLLAMLLVGDELSAATARFQAEVEGIKDRARRMLADGGLA